MQGLFVDESTIFFGTVLRRAVL